MHRTLAKLLLEQGDTTRAADALERLMFVDPYTVEDHAQLAALYDRLNDVTVQLDRLTTKLNQGQGTMGLLMQDQKLYDNMNKTVTELHDLVADIRKDPKKFLSAKISIF